MLLLVLPLHAAAAEGPPDEIEDILEKPGITAEEFQKMDLSGVLQKIKGSLAPGKDHPVHLMARIVGAVLFSAAVLSLAPQQEWQNVLETVCVMAIFLFTLGPALRLAARVGECVLEWRNYLASFVPVFSGVLVSCGQPGQAAVYGGMFLTMAVFSAQLIATVVMPVLQVYIALNTASGICGVGGLSEGCALMAKGIKWVLGLLSVLFSAVLGLQSALAQTTDNLAMKTGRFLVSSGIPVVGSMGSVLSGLKVLKGSLGFAAVAALSIAFLPLLLESGGCCIAYYLGGAVSRAFGLDKAGKVLEGMGQAVGLCVSFLVFFFILVVLATALMILMGGG